MNEPSKPWTRRQLQNRMRAAGWVSVPGPRVTYAHPDGGAVDLDQYLAGRGPLWRWYASAHQLPDPRLGAVEQGAA